MKKKLWKSILMLLVVVLIGTMFVGCQETPKEEEQEVDDSQEIAQEKTQEEEKEEAKTTRTIIDQRGLEIEVPLEIERLVLLPMPLPSIVYSIVGNGDSVIGMHPTSMIAVERSILAEMAPEMLKAETGFVTKGFDVNIEELLKLNPQVVVQWGHVPEVIEKMETAGLTVVVIEVRTGDSQENFEEWIRIIGELFGKEERAIELSGLQRDIIEGVKESVTRFEQADRPGVFFFFNEELRTAGGNTHHNFWLETSGGINVARDLEGWKNVDMEQILKWNPEVIFVSNFTDIMPQDILENRIEGQDWSQVEAVKSGRVYKVPEGVYRWEPPNAERALLLQWAAQKYFPQGFVGLDMTEVVIDFYKEFFVRTLTEEEAKKILQFEHNYR
ncbi:MAG: ABC transporter substrate-binding protein [Alkaliphilus sp.]